MYEQYDTGRLYTLSQDCLLYTSLASLGKNGNFLLMHSVGSIPHGTEIDVPLNYADYYFLEALKRKRDIEEGTR